MRYSITYHLKKNKSIDSLLVARVSYGYMNHTTGKYEQMPLTTGVNIKSKYFDSKKGIKHGAPQKSINDFTDWKSTLEKKLNDISSTKDLRLITPQELRKLLDRPVKSTAKNSSLVAYIMDYVAMEEKKLADNDNDKLDVDTIGNYRQLADKIQEYGDTSIDSLDYEWANAFLNWLTKEHKFALGTCVKFFRKIKKIAGLIGKRIISPKNHGWREKQITKPYLTFEDLKFMEDFDFLSHDEIKKITSPFMRNQKLKMLENTRKSFLFMCLTGMRISDYKARNVELLKENGKWLLRIPSSIKTGEEAVIPCVPYVKNLLDENFEYNISDKNFRDNIREIIKFVFPDRMFMQVTRYNNDVQQEEVKFSEADSVSTHLGRRSVASNFYNLGFSIEDIMCILGIVKKETVLSYIHSGKVKRASNIQDKFEKLVKDRPELAHLVA